MEREGSALVAEGEEIVDSAAVVREGEDMGGHLLRLLLGYLPLLERVEDFISVLRDYIKLVIKGFVTLEDGGGLLIVLTQIEFIFDIHNGNIK